MTASRLIQTPGRVVANVRRRTLTIRGRFGAGPDEISSAMVADALERLGPGRILILLDSPGGIVFELDRILEMLLAWQWPIRVRVDNEASSGAALIVASFWTDGHVDSRYMIHRAWRTVDTPANPELIREALEETDQQTVDILAKKLTGFTRFEIGRMVAMGNTLTAREAKNLGLIDGVYGTKPGRMVRSA